MRVCFAALKKENIFLYFVRSLERGSGEVLVQPASLMSLVTAILGRVSLVICLLCGATTTLTLAPEVGRKNQFSSTVTYLLGAAATYSNSLKLLLSAFSLKE